jgi:phosphonate degradation associated HDIG domain protein
MTVAQEIEELFGKGGSEAYFGERVTQLQHALQSANLAVKADADDELVLAALLHDIGHLLGGQLDADLGVIDHDRSCLEWLRERGFSARVIELIGGHVAAKRYLVATNPAYRDRLSEASERTLRLQGGPMNQDEIDAFESNPHYKDMLRLRSWDEQAKDPEAVAPGLDTYLGMIR